MMYSFNLQDFPYEVIVHIMEGLDSYERSRGCVVSTLFEKACTEASKNLSSYRLYYEEPSILRKLVQRFSNMRREDNYILTELNETISNILDESDYHLVVRMKNKWVFRYCYKVGFVGYGPMVNLFARWGSDRDIRNMLNGICEGNHLELSTVILRKSKGIDFLSGGNGHVSWVDFLFRHTGKSGDKNMVNSIYTELRAMGYIVGYEYTRHVFSGACEEGHLDLCTWAVGECRKNNVELDDDTLLEHFERACIRGYLHIVTFLIEEFDLLSKDSDQIYGAIYGAAMCDHIDVIEYLSKLHFGDFWEAALGGACGGGNKRIIDLAKQAVGDSPIKCNRCNTWLNEGHP